MMFDEDRGLLYGDMVSIAVKQCMQMKYPVMVVLVQQKVSEAQERHPELPSSVGSETKILWHRSK